MVVCEEEDFIRSMYLFVSFRTMMDNMYKYQGQRSKIIHDLTQDHAQILSTVHNVHQNQDQMSNTMHGLSQYQATIPHSGSVLILIS